MPECAVSPVVLSARVYGVSQVTGNTRLQTAVLEDLSDAHRYRRWLADLARPHLGPNPIEIGSGTGDYALEWVDDVARFTATEADEERYRALSARFAGNDRITTRHLLLDGSLNGSQSRAHGGGDPGAPYSAAVAYNVLEHIPDDVGALRALGSLVRPGGAIVLIVPAFPSAMSDFDREIGHQRRYTKATLRATLHDAGLMVQELRYVNPVGLASWYVVVKALRRRPQNGPALRLYDRVVVPLARAVDRWPIPFGQSVFAVARVPGTPSEAGLEPEG